VQNVRLVIPTGGTAAFADRSGGILIASNICAVASTRCAPLICFFYSFHPFFLTSFPLFSI
jgi:hypothetical protein